MTVLWSTGLEGTDGVNITAANSDFAECVPSGTSVAQFEAATAHVGSTCGKYTSSTIVTHKTSTFTATGEVWWDGYIYVGTAPTSNTVLVQFFDQTGAYAAELRYQQASGTAALRDSTFTLRVEVTLVAGWNRVAARVAPSAGANAGLEIYSYSGANLDTDTPTYSDATAAGTAWGTATGITRVDMGILSTPGNTPVFYYDDIEVATVQRVMGGGTPGVAVWDLSYVVDATGSTGTTSLTQTGGTSVGVITEDPTGVYTFGNPSGTDSLVFDLDAGTDTEVVTIDRGTGAGRPAYYSKTASGWV